MPTRWVCVLDRPRVFEFCTQGVFIVLDKSISIFTTQEKPTLRVLLALDKSFSKFSFKEKLLKLQQKNRRTLFAHGEGSRFARKACPLYRGVAGGA